MVEMSLGLVSYESSSSSDVSDDDENVDRPSAEPKLNDQNREGHDVGQQLKLSLPPPKKRGNAIKITAPAIPELDSDDEDEPQPKKVKSGKKISSLFAMLPEPKHATLKQTNRILVPHTLTKKKAPPPRVPSHPRVNQRAPAPHEDGSDEEGEGNYFSLGDSVSEGKPESSSSDVAGPGVGPSVGPDRPGITVPSVDKTEGKRSQQSSLLASLAVLPKKNQDIASKWPRTEQFPRSINSESGNPGIQQPFSNHSVSDPPAVKGVRTFPGNSNFGSPKPGPSKLVSSKLVSSSSREQDEPKHSSSRSQERTSKLVCQPEESSQRPPSKLVSAQPELDEQPLSFSSRKTPYGYQRLSAVSSTVPHGGGYAGVHGQTTGQYHTSYQGGGYYDQYNQTGVEEPATSSYEADSSLIADEEFQKLIGKEKFDPSLLIDVNADDHMSKVSAEEWTLKGLTEETEARQQLKKDQLPTSQQKRKHQITYLARQAKERELELKNSWANNRMTRKETQAKYGF